MTIPYSVTSIAKEAFRRCVSSKELSGHASVVLVGISTFPNCTSLVKITLLASNITFVPARFMGFTSLRETYNLIPMKISMVKLYLGVDSKVQVKKPK